MKWNHVIKYSKPIDEISNLYYNGSTKYSELTQEEWVQSKGVGSMNITISARNTSVRESFKEHAEKKLAKIGPEVEMPELKRFGLK